MKHGGDVEGGGFVNADIRPFPPLEQDGHPPIITTNPLRHHTAGSTNVIMVKTQETRDRLYLDLLFIITVCQVDSHI